MRLFISSFCRTLYSLPVLLVARFKGSSVSMHQVGMSQRTQNFLSILTSNRSQTKCVKSSTYQQTCLQLSLQQAFGSSYQLEITPHPSFLEINISAVSVHLFDMLNTNRSSWDSDFLVFNCVKTFWLSLLCININGLQFSLR